MVKKAPVIRFNGFEDDWEQRKLNDLAEINPKSSLPDKFQYVDLESVVGTELIYYRTETRDSAPSRAQRLAKTGDIFYQTVRPYQKNNYHFNLPYQNYVFSTGYAQLRPFVDSSFLFTKIQEEGFVAKVLDRCTGTSYPAINANDLASIEVRFPTIVEEQTRIGNFFQALDNVIALHQRKIELLQQLKKGFLQKMFPNGKGKSPQIRFAYFEDDWEQRQVKEIFEVTRGQVLSSKKVSPIKNETMKYPVYSSQTKNDGLMGYYNDFLFESAITWTTDGANAGTVSYREGKFYSTNVNGVLLSDQGFATKASAEALNLIAWKYVSRVGNPKLMNNIMSEIKVTLPLKICELNIISDFFNQTDQIAILNQKKIDNINLFKNSLLQKMFI